MPRTVPDEFTMRAQVGAYFQVCDEFGSTSTLVAVLRRSFTNPKLSRTDLKSIYREVLVRIRETWDAQRLARWRSIWRQLVVDPLPDPLDVQYLQAVKIIRRGVIRSVAERDAVRAVFEALWQPHRTRFPLEYDQAAQLLDRV